MNNHLSSIVSKLKSQEYSELYIVLGNESCDLDSAVCALVYATFLDWQHNQLKCKVCTKQYRDKTYKDAIFIPILDVNRDDYNLKTEVEYCFKEHGIDASNLIFRDDENWLELVTTTKTSVVLVDHHVISENNKYLVPYVTEIIDHRPIDKINWTYKDDTRSTIELVGSCSTLVCQRIKDLTALLSKNGDFFKAYPVASDLLHSVIILDTANFSKKVNKATPHDVEIVEFLENTLKLSNANEDRSRKMARLVAARSDVSSLTAAQLLKKDVKVVVDVLVPSFPILVQEFLQRPGALDAIAFALESQQLSKALLLGMSLAGGLSRDGAVYTKESAHTEEFAKFLQEWSSPPLQLSQEDVKVTGVIYFKQLNLSASRKQYMPAVNAFIQNNNM